jgi:hypothetical protein
MLRKEKNAGCVRSGWVGVCGGGKGWVVHFNVFYSMVRNILLLIYEYISNNEIKDKGGK